MTVTTTARLAGPFVGNSVTVSFPFAFKVFASTDLVVVQSVAGVQTTLVNGTDYTVALNANQDTAPGGTINFAAAPDNTKTLAITSNVPQTQTTVVTNNGGFFPDVFNAVFDRAVILIQQLAQTLSRAITIPITASGITSLQISPVPSGVVMWSADGTQLVSVPGALAALVPALPAMAGHGGQFLTNDGISVASWAAVVPATRNFAAAGLVTGGGNLSADRTFTVTASSAGDVQAGTSTSTAVTPAALAASSAQQTLTDASTVAWNMALGFNAKVTVGGSRTIGTPTNPVAGATYALEHIQDATGGRVPSLPTAFDFGVAGTPAFSTAANARDILFLYCYDAATPKFRASLNKSA